MSLGATSLHRDLALVAWALWLDIVGIRHDRISAPPGVSSVTGRTYCLIVGGEHAQRQRHQEPNPKADLLHLNVVARCLGEGPHIS